MNTAEAEWDDWELRTILDEDDDAMDIGEDFALSLDQEQEVTLFWSRVPKQEDCFDDSMITDDEEDSIGFSLIPFQEISTRDLPKGSHQRRRSLTELDKFSEAPPLSWEEGVNDDDSIVSEDGGNGSKNPGLFPETMQPSSIEFDPTTTSASYRRESRDDIMFQRQQRVMKDVMHHPVRGVREQPRPAPEQKQLLREVEQSYKKRHQAPSMPTSNDDIFARQQQIMKELCKNKTKTVIDRRPVSPICVSQRLTRAGMDSDEYYEFKEKLILRQQSLLQKSMQRSLETRQALYARTEQTKGYQRADQVSHVLKQIETSSQRITATYYPKQGGGGRAQQVCSFLLS